MGDLRIKSFEVAHVLREVNKNPRADIFFTWKPTPPGDLVSVEGNPAQRTRAEQLEEC